MAVCRTSQPAGFDTIDILSLSPCFTSSVAFPVPTSSSECFQLLPSTLTRKSQPQSPSNDILPCLQPLSRIPLHLHSAALLTKQQAFANRRIRRLSHPFAQAAQKFSLLTPDIKLASLCQYSTRNDDDDDWSCHYGMPWKKPVPKKQADFCMKTRSRTTNVTPEPSQSSGEDSALSSLNTTPSTPPQLSCGHKRKLSDSSSDAAEIIAQAKQPSREPSLPAALSTPSSSSKRKGRLSVVGSATVEIGQKTAFSSPHVQQALTPPDSAHSSRRGSRVVGPEAHEPLPEITSSPEIPSTLVTPKSPISLRRSARFPSSDTAQPAANDSRLSNDHDQRLVLQSQPDPTSSRKRKSDDSNSDAASNAPKRKCASQIPKATVQKPSVTFQRYKDKDYWPGLGPKDTVYFANEGTTRYGIGETGDAAESRSPKKPARGGARGGRGGGHASGNGRGRGKLRGRGGRGGESPDPPNRRDPLSQEEKIMIGMLKTRQQELRRFFSTVGAQQVEILDQMACRDLNRIARKPNAHKKVSEFETIMEELQVGEEDAENLARKRYDIQVEAEMRRLEQEREVIEQQFLTRIEEARKEHLAGAEGDIILFERAYRAAHDNMHTESGSDMLDYLPHYHELPEPNTQPRGYSSSKILDEKPFMRQLEETYDEQARQEVLNEDVIAPLLKQMEERNREWREEQERKQCQTMEALSEEATKELEKIDAYLVSRPVEMGQVNSCALSALADVSEWVAQQDLRRQYVNIPLTNRRRLSAQALNFSPIPAQILPRPPPQEAYQQVIRPESRPRGRKLKYPPLNNGLSNITNSAPPSQSQYPSPSLSGAHEYTTPSAPSFTSAPPHQGPRIVSAGRGQAIAPAPPKATPRANIIFRHNTRYGPPPPVPPPPQTTQLAISTPAHSHSHSRQNSYTLTSPLSNGSGPQQFIFQTPQQPFPHQAAPQAPQYARMPASAQGSGSASAPEPAAMGTSTDTPPAIIGPRSNLLTEESPTTNTPASTSGAIPGQQTKIPITFVNQTIASRNAAAQAAFAGGVNGKGVELGNGGAGGKRVLLPKVQSYSDLGSK